MQIINDTEVFDPQECLFALAWEDPHNPNYVMIALTDKKYWEEEGCLNDCFGDHSLPPGAIPQGIWNDMEAMWGTDSMSLDNARQALIKAGFVESKEMAERLFPEE